MAVTAFYSNKEEKYHIYNDSDLGFTYTPERTTFKVWAPTAELVLLKLYTTGSFHEAGAQVMGIKQMLFDSLTGVWSATVEGNLDKVYYTYVVKTEKGTHETQDIYSKSVGVNSQRSMVVDLAATNPEGWENDRHVLPETPNDAVIWEVHVRDFSCSDSSGVSKEHRGKFLDGAVIQGQVVSVFQPVIGLLLPVALDDFQKFFRWDVLGDHRKIHQIVFQRDAHGDPGLPAQAEAVKALRGMDLPQ